MEINNLNLLHLAIHIADKLSDGHFTLLKFTTNWRAGFFTPDSREDIQKLFEGETMRDAILNAILDKINEKFENHGM